MDAGARARAEAGREVGAGYPPRAVRVLELAQRVGLLISVASENGHGGAVSASEISARALALRPVERTARRAQVAAYNALVEERERGFAEVCLRPAAPPLPKLSTSLERGTPPSRPWGLRPQTSRVASLTVSSGAGRAVPRPWGAELRPGPLPRKDTAVGLPGESWEAGGVVGVWVSWLTRLPKAGFRRPMTFTLLPTAFTGMSMGPG